MPDYPLTPSEEEARRRCIIDPSSCLANNLTPAQSAADLLENVASQQKRSGRELAEAQGELVCELVGVKPGGGTTP